MPEGYARKDGTIQPGVRPRRTPQRVPEYEVAVWQAPILGLGDGAYTAAVVLCHKLSFHGAGTHRSCPVLQTGRGSGRHVWA